MEGFDIGLAGALGAGLLSFVSPCVLPLVPPYLCFIGGVSLEQLTEGARPDAAAGRRVFAAACAFVLGFMTVFVALGATASMLGQLVTDHLDSLSYAAGIIVIVLGLHFLGVLRIGFLDRELRIQVGRPPAGLIGAYVVGLAFAFGWTPCVGPVLAAILFVAAGDQSVLRGALLLAAYSLGIGIPFLLAALAARPFLAFMARFRRHYRRVERVLGAALDGTGVLFLTGSMVEIANWLLITFPGLGTFG